MAKTAAAVGERSIWKYPLVHGREHLVDMPQGARILAIQRQGMAPTLWALVDPVAPKVRRRFEIVGTGWLFDASTLTYVGTWQDDVFVWHLFERTEAS